MKAEHCGQIPRKLNSKPTDFNSLRYKKKQILDWRRKQGEP